MNKMTYKQILKEIKKQCDSVSDFAYEGLEIDAEEWEKSKKSINKVLGEFEEVEQKGGMGEGEEWYVVWYFKDHDVYIRVDGFYQSYTGTSFDEGWDCCSEVRPREKTIIVYE